MTSELDRQHRELLEANYRLEERRRFIETVLSGPMLHSNAELTWKYLAQIADAARGATCNRAHEVIAEMERHFRRVWTLTQNVDGLHRLAGSSNVIEIHGNMHSLSCMACSLRIDVDEDTQIEIP